MSWSKASTMQAKSADHRTSADLIVLLFGLNPVFFKFTSLPFTEALAFSLAFGALIAVARAQHSRAVFWAAAAGCLGGLSYLTRTQMVGLALALPLSFVLGLRGPTRWWAAGASAVTFGLVALGWALHLATAVERFSPMMLLDMGASRETLELGQYRQLVATSSIWQYASDRIRGLFVAFNGFDRASYVRSFGPSAYLIPVAALVAGLRWRSRGASSSAPRADTVVVATVLAGLTSLAITHHSHFWAGWGFGFRYGLPLILALAVAVPYLMSCGRAAARRLVLASLLLSLVTSGTRVFQLLRSRPPGPTASQHALASWIDRQSPTPVFLSTAGPTLAATTRGLFQTIECRDSASQVRAFLDHLPIDYVITISRDVGCPSFEGIKGSLDPVRTFGEGADTIAVWRSHLGG